MRPIGLVFICGIFMAAATNITIPELETSPNTAELTLETVLGFNSTENVDNIHFLDKVQKVIGNIKSAFERKNSNRRVYSEKIEKFTDFIRNLIKNLMKYDDADLKYFISVLNNEMRKYHYRGCKFHELIQNYSLRRYLSSVLNNIQAQSAENLRNKLKAFANKLEKENFNRHEGNLVEVINSVYRRDTLKNFKHFLRNLDSYRLKTGKMNLDLVKIIKEGLRLIIFDHYSQLNQNARMELKFQVNEFWKYISQNLPSVSVNPIKSKNSNNISINTDANDANKILKHSMHPSSSNLKQDENKLNKTKSDTSSIITQNGETEKHNKTTHKTVLISKNSVITTNEKDKHVKKKKHSGRKKAQIMTTRYLLTKTKRLTFKTLYPELVPEWTKTHSFIGEAQAARRSHTRWQIGKDDILEPEGLRGEQFDEFGRTTKVHVLKEGRTYDKFKKEVPITIRGFNRRKVIRRVMHHKATRQKHSKTNPTNKSYKHLTDLSSESVDNCTSNTKDSTVSDEGLSIESFKEVKTNISQRRSETNLNITVKSTVTELNNMLQAKVTQGLSKIDNTPINSSSNINIGARKEASDDKYEIDNIDKEQINKTPSKKENKQLDNSIASSSTLDVNKATTYISVVDTLLNATERLHVNKNREGHDYNKNNKELLRFSSQTTRDEGVLFNFRASSNKTETEAEKNKEYNHKTDLILSNNTSVIHKKKDLDKNQAKQDKLSNEQNKNQPKITMDKRNLKTDNDFKSFILDYENDLNEFKKTVATKKSAEISSLVTKSNIKTEKNTPRTSISTVTTPPVTANPILRVSIIANKGPQNALINYASSININQNRYLETTTNMLYTFDAKLIKELMKKTTKRSTTRISTIMGKLFNKDGVVFDSLEEVKQELYDTALNNQEFDYEKGKGTDYENHK